MALPRTGRIGTQTNLTTGATYDILLVSTPEGYPKGLISFEFQDTPRKITGIQKVAQFFIKVLFTTKGSDVIHQGYGTIFPEIALGANRTTDDSVFLADVTTAVKDAEGQTRFLLGGNRNDLASQLESVTILGLNTNIESLNMYVKMTTKAGESASIAIPFPQLDLKLANENGN